jgi:hypothetical protein
MLRRGSPPYLECSSRGEKRLSAFYARIKGRGGRSIEEIYQAAKVFRNGDTGLPIDEAKGFRPVNVKECRELYARLWDEYVAENPDLLDLICSQSGLTDRFGQFGHACQVIELWRIRNAHLADDLAGMPGMSPQSYEEFSRDCDRLDGTR